MAGYSWQGPRCLIETVESQEYILRINEETINLLKEVKVPVHVVAIAGLYRTGKSYLLNKLAGRNTGIVQALWGETKLKSIPKGIADDRKNPALFQAFDLGATIQAKTKGIWAWCRPHPQNNNQCLLLIDTEGLGDPEKGDRDHDAWIFVLAVLLSSTLVYNSKGTIDQDALDKLSFITDMSEHVKVKSGTDDANNPVDGYFPNFVWAVRDFHLEMAIDGEPCTENEYMEHALKLKSGVSQKICRYNAPRKSLKMFFPTRKCFVFPQPLEDMKRINHLDGLPDIDLNEDFKKVTCEFLQFIFNRSQPKSFHGATVTGSGLANLCEIYVKAIQDGAVPCIENAVDAMARAENIQAVENALQLYSTEIRMIHFPTDTVERLSNHQELCEKTAIKAFLTTSIFDKDQQYQTKLAELIHAEYEKVQLENERASRSKCQEILEKLYNPIAANKASGNYIKPGGYMDYKNDMEQLQTRFNEAQDKGFKAAEILMTFMNDRESEHNFILAADIKLAAEDRKVAEGKQKAEQAERERVAAVVESERLRRMKSDQEKSYEEHAAQLNKKRKTEIENLTKEYDQQLAEKIKYYEESLKNNYTKEAGDLLAEIESLKAVKRETVVIPLPVLCAIM